MQEHDVFETVPTPCIASFSLTMLHVAFIRALIDGQLAMLSSAMIYIERREDGGLLLYSCEHCTQTAPPHRRALVTITTERVVVLTADVHRRRWYLHVSMASGMVDVTVLSRYQQSRWSAILKPVTKHGLLKRS